MGPALRDLARPSPKKGFYVHVAVRPSVNLNLNHCRKILTEHLVPMGFLWLKVRVELVAPEVYLYHETKSLELFQFCKI